MGHAGAIISGGRGTAQSKVDALTAAGVRVAQTPSQIPQMLIEAGVRPG
jgi:succinyl-CoA synthetase alpha subunit